MTEIYLYIATCPTENKGRVKNFHALIVVLQPLQFRHVTASLVARFITDIAHICIKQGLPIWVRRCELDQTSCIHDGTDQNSC